MPYIEACFTKEVYEEFVLGLMSEQQEEIFLSHVDLCWICMQAVRTIERELKQKKHDGS